MSDSLIDAVLDCSSQRIAFEHDGALRDMYIQNATTTQWMLVVVRIQSGNYGVRLQRGGASASLPKDFDALFGGKLDGDDRYFMSFSWIAPHDKRV